MNVGSFDTLQAVLVGAGLKRGRNFSESAKLALFLDWVARGTSVRDAASSSWTEMSVESVHRCRSDVLGAIMRVSKTYIQSPRTAAALKESTRAWVASSPKFFPFAGCVGAVDGSHVRMEVPSDMYERWHVARKGGCTTNVAAVCDANCRITFVAPGASGRCHDGDVLRITEALKCLPEAPGWFWLGDAGYGLSSKIMTPYDRAGVRYHLKEFSRTADMRPRNKEELYNLRHSQLRNAIERSFGQLQTRFHLLKGVLNCNIETNIKLIAACCILHNFLLDEGDGVTPADRRLWGEEQRHHQVPVDEDHDIEVELGQVVVDGDVDDVNGNAAPVELQFVGAPLPPSARRDLIATTLWNQYVAVMADRGVQLVEAEVDNIIHV